MSEHEVSEAIVTTGAVFDVTCPDVLCFVVGRQKLSELARELFVHLESGLLQAVGAVEVFFAKLCVLWVEDWQALRELLAGVFFTAVFQLDAKLVVFWVLGVHGVCLLYTSDAADE